MPFTAPRLKLTKKQRSQLEAITRRRSVPASAVFRARILLGLAVFAFAYDEHWHHRGQI